MSYEEFERRVKQLSNIANANSVLGWDQEVMMPEKGIKARAKQKSTLSTIHHQKLTSDELASLIENLELEDTSEEQQAVLREVKREHRKAKKVPEELNEKISEKESETVEIWKKTKEDSDFETFAPHLQELVELKREYADAINPDEEPYKVLFYDYEPYIEYETMERILERLRENLTDLVERIRATEKSFDKPLEGDFDAETQMEMSKDLVERLGFDFERGRLDTSAHPFTNGNQFDTRITTRFNENDISEGLGATVHETGHALYQLGLPKEHYGTPLGQSRDLSVHESQSRLWENHIYKSEEFWRYFAPQLQNYFDIDATPRGIYESINQVDPDNKIRIFADEVTYHLHIVLRFEIGKALINGDIEVEELPELWNDKMEEYLGVRPETDAEGCMQDIHWAWGSFGYFPTYSLGSVLAAQIFDEVQNSFDVQKDIENGDFKQLRVWLREHVHQHGQRYRTEKLIEKATGGPFTADYFLDYIEEKYTDIYGI